MNTILNRAIQHQIMMTLSLVSVSGAKTYGSHFKHKGYAGNFIYEGNFVVPKIHWELNWLNQWDQKLINFIKNELLIPPPTHSDKNFLFVSKYDPNMPWKHQGQNGEALAVEYLYGLDKISKRGGYLSLIHI